MLKGERQREFVLSHKQEPHYLEACPQPLQDLALLILDTGVRPGEACKLEWSDVHLEPAINARFGYIHIAGGKSRYAKRNLGLTSSQRNARSSIGGKNICLGFPSENGTSSF